MLLQYSSENGLYFFPSMIQKQRWNWMKWMEENKASYCSLQEERVQSKTMCVLLPLQLQNTDPLTPAESAFTFW